MPDLATVIGDLVSSRRSADRGAVQRRLAEVAAEVNAVLEPAQPFEPTVGDEFQGAFATVPQALTGSLLLRLRLREVIDTRVGVGWGEVTVHDAERRPLLQDGPGWWAARDALEELGRRRGPNTWFEGPDAGRVNAFLLCRDALVDHLNDRGRRILALALGGASQKEIAQREGVTASAVSQQFSRGVGAVVQAHAQLAGSQPGEGGRR